MTCKDCRFWMGESWQKAHDYPTLPWSAQCRRHAPSAQHVLKLTAEHDGGCHEGSWPVTEQTAWCGDFEAKLNG